MAFTGDVNRKNAVVQAYYPQASVLCVGGSHTRPLKFHAALHSGNFYILAMPLTSQYKPQFGLYRFGNMEYSSVR